MEAMPQAALVLIPPQLIFGILVKALDVVPAMRIFHQHLQWRGSGKIAPVVGRIAGAPASGRSPISHPRFTTLSLCA
jgi:hypothetical protein